MARLGVFRVLIVLSAAIGAATGVLFVNSTDLPQVGELEHYRPSSITQLYDDQKKVVGSFALQRRVIASYDDFPQSYATRLISIEDKDFYSHWGITYGALRVRLFAISSQADVCRVRRH